MGVYNSILQPGETNQMGISSSRFTNKCHSSKKGSQGKPITTAWIISHSHTPESVSKRHPKVLDTKTKTDPADVSSFHYILTLFLVQLLPLSCAKTFNLFFVVLQGLASKPFLWQKAKLSALLFLLKVRQLRIS